MIGIGAEPATAIGQRALLITTPAGNVLWDMITYLDDELIRQVRELGGVSAIAISHPHFYGSMIEYAHAFDAPVYIHAKRPRVGRPARPGGGVLGGRHPADRRRPDARSTSASTSRAARCCTGRTGRAGPAR